MIQRKTMRGDPSADMHSDGRQLLPINPPSRAARKAFAVDSEVTQRIYERLFNGTHIGHYVALPFSQIENRVAHDLSRSVISNVAAAIRMMEGDACAAKHLL